jgi:hypothetical protein
MVAELSPPMPVENILLNQKQKINMKGSIIRGCSLLPDGRVVFYCYNTDIVRFMDKDGVELFEIGKGKKDIMHMIQLILKITIALLYHQMDLIDVYL